MRSIFCGRNNEMQRLQKAWGKVSDKDNPKPQLITLLAESGLGGCPRIGSVAKITGVP
jgi:hypothetical protein